MRQISDSEEAHRVIDLAAASATEVERLMQERTAEVEEFDALRIIRDHRAEVRLAACVKRIEEIDRSVFVLLSGILEALGSH